MSERNLKFGAVCEHGSLARKCETCYAIKIEAELAEITAERDALRAFAQEIINPGGKSRGLQVESLAHKHGLLKVEGDVQSTWAFDLLKPTPLLTGEPQEVEG